MRVVQHASLLDPDARATERLRRPTSWKFNPVCEASFRAKDPSEGDADGAGDKGDDDEEEDRERGQQQREAEE